MTTTTKIKLSTIMILLLFPLTLLFAKKQDTAVRHINIAGLVFNSATLLPLGAANIYDDANKLLGTTDAKGYFNISLSYSKSGELYFKLNIKKQGYRDFTESEHWGDLQDNSKTVMYFGLQARGGSESAYSSFGGRASNLSYESVLTGFDKVKKEKTFNDKLQVAEAGNQNAFIQIDNSFFIVDKGGWIKINSGTDSVIIDNKQAITADQLNKTLKRSKIKGMSPLNLGNTKIAVYTR